MMPLSMSAVSTRSENTWAHTLTNSVAPLLEPFAHKLTEVPPHLCCVAAPECLRVEHQQSPVEPRAGLNEQQEESTPSPVAASGIATKPHLRHLPQRAAYSERSP